METMYILEHKQPFEYIKIILCILPVVNGVLDKGTNLCMLQWFYSQALLQMH